MTGYLIIDVDKGSVVLFNGITMIINGSGKPDEYELLSHEEALEFLANDKYDRRLQLVEVLPLALVASAC